MTERDSCRLLVIVYFIYLTFVSMSVTSLPTSESTNIRPTPSLFTSVTSLSSSFRPTPTTMTSKPILRQITSTFTLFLSETTRIFQPDLNCSDSAKARNSSVCKEDQAPGFNYLPLVIGVTIGAGVALLLIILLIVGGVMVKRRRSSVPRLPPPRRPPKRMMSPEGGIRPQGWCYGNDDKQSSYNDSSGSNDTQQSYLDIQDGNTEYSGDQTEWEQYLASEALQNDFYHFGVFKIPYTRTSDSLWFAHTATFKVSGRELYDMARRMRESSNSGITTYSGQNQPILVAGKSYRSSEMPWPLSESQLDGVRDLGANKRVVLRVVKHLEYLVIGVALQTKEAELTCSMEALKNSL